MELHNLVPAPNIAGLIKSRGMQWATSVSEGNENCEENLRKGNQNLLCRYNDSTKV